MTGSSNGSGPASVEASVGSEAAAPAAPAAAAPPRSNVDRPAFVRASAGGDNDDAINLGSTVLPVILKSYAPHLAAAAVAWSSASSSDAASVADFPLPDARCCRFRPVRQDSNWRQQQSGSQAARRWRARASGIGCLV